MKHGTSPPGYPVLGHAVDFLSDKLGFLTRCAEQYGDVVELKIGRRIYLLNHPEDVQYVLETHSSNYEKGPGIIGRTGKKLYGDSLFSASAARHSSLRQQLQPVFSRQNFSVFAEIILETTEETINHWKDGEEMDIAFEMMRLTHRINGKMLFGLDFMREAQELGQAVTIRRRYIQYVFDSLFPFPEHRPNRMNREFRQAMKCFDETVYRLIQERRQSPQESRDMLSLFLKVRGQDGNPMSDSEIRDELLTLSSAGYETTAEALSWTWLLLSQHPEVESKFSLELQEGLKDKRPKLEDAVKLQYTEKIFSESMRLYPPTWLFIRITKEKDTLPSGAVIPAGAKLYLSPYVMQRNPDYFPDPERFDPERFSDSLKKSRPRFSYFPFGGGPRVCIGQSFATLESILILAAIAQRFHFKLLPGQKIIPDPKVTLRPKCGIKMRLARR